MYHLLTCSMLVITDQHAPSLKIELDFITAWYCDTVKYFLVQMNLVISRISWTTTKVRFFFFSTTPPLQIKHSGIQLPNLTSTAFKATLIPSWQGGPITLCVIFLVTAPYTTLRK